jgi:hypothetical protein
MSPQALFDENIVEAEYTLISAEDLSQRNARLTSEVVHHEVGAIISGIIFPFATLVTLGGLANDSVITTAIAGSITAASTAMLIKSLLHRAKVNSILEPQVTVDRSIKVTPPKSVSTPPRSKKPTRDRAPLVGKIASVVFTATGLALTPIIPLAGVPTLIGGLAMRPWGRKVLYYTVAGVFLALAFVVKSSIEASESAPGTPSTPRTSHSASTRTQSSQARPTQSYQRPEYKPDDPYEISPGDYALLLSSPEVTKCPYAIA